MVCYDVLFDFYIAEDRSKCIIVETDMDDCITRGVHEVKEMGAYPEPPRNF
jgi:hypothetical protein